MKVNKAIKVLNVKHYLPLVAIVIATFVGAHGGGHPTRYVSVNGEDKGECGSPLSACASISFAVQMSSKGDKIRVSEGKYVLDELDVFYLLSDMIEIQGGYQTVDGFETQDAAKYVTTIEGVPFRYREQLAERGFRLLQDQKGVDIELGETEKTWLALYSKLTSKTSAEAQCIDGMSGDNPCHNIDRVAHIPLSQFSSQPGSANDIWGFVDLNTQREYALMGVSNGTTIFDLNDPSAPLEVGHISAAASTWRDIKVYQYFDSAEERYKAYAYVTTESSQGLQIIDLNELPERVSLAANPRGDFSTAHNVYLANTEYSTGLALSDLTPYLYIAGSDRDQGVFLTYDLSDPLAPALLTQGNAGYIHDATTFVIDDERVSACSAGHNPCEILVDFNEDSVDIWDMTDKAAPFLISKTSYDNLGYVHSGWWSADKQTIFVQDEVDELEHGLNTTLRALDISDLSRPCLSSIYTGPTSAIDHNGFTNGDYYYMSNYRRGLSVLDVSDLTNIRDVGFFDTYAVPSQNIPGFDGAWGTYPFLNSGNILVSDIRYGLWVLKLNENDGEVSEAGTTQSFNCDTGSEPSEPGPVEPEEPINSGSDDQQVDAPSGSSGGGSVSMALLGLMALLLFRRRWLS